MLGSIDRVTWLLLVPLCGALAPWLISPSSDTQGAEGVTGRVVVVAITPLLGATCAVIYGLVFINLRATLPLLPLALSTVFFCAATFIVLTQSDAEGSTLDVARFVEAVLQPALALGGGALCLRAASRLERGSRFR